MQIQTGRVATVEATFDIQYCCSSCGKENLFTETISGSANTGTVLGIDLDQDLTKHAQESLLKNIFDVMDQSNPKRFRSANFSCKCRNCGYAEPWASMQFPTLHKLGVLVCYTMIILTLIAFFSIFIIAKEKSISPTILILYAVLALNIAAYFGINAYFNKKCKALEQQIAALPKESLPTILPHSKERHENFYSAPVVPTPTQATYDKWTCAECGTQNSTRYAQCKKCGKYKIS